MQAALGFVASVSVNGGPVTVLAERQRLPIGPSAVELASVG